MTDPGLIFGLISLLIGAVGFVVGRREARQAHQQAREAQEQARQMEKRLLNQLERMQHLFASGLDREPPVVAAAELAGSAPNEALPRPHAMHLVRVMRSLPERDQAILRAYLDGAQSDEIAEAFGETPEWISSILEGIQNKLARRPHQLEGWQEP